MNFVLAPAIVLASLAVGTIAGALNVTLDLNAAFVTLSALIPTAAVVIHGKRAKKERGEFREATHADAVATVDQVTEQIDVVNSRIGKLDSRLTTLEETIGRNGQ